VALPPGFVGNPTAIPYCTQAQFEVSRESCPASIAGGEDYTCTSTQIKRTCSSRPYTTSNRRQDSPGSLASRSARWRTSRCSVHVRSDGDYGLTADIKEHQSSFDPVRIAALIHMGCALG